MGVQMTVEGLRKTLATLPDDEKLYIHPEFGLVGVRESDIEADGKIRGLDRVWDVPFPAQ